MTDISYSHKYFPPAPILSIRLASLEDGTRFGPFDCLIDTGADGTFVPTSLLEKLDVVLSHLTNVHSHMGDKMRRVSVYKVDIILADNTRLPSIDVVSDDWGDQIILGRNVLNKLQLLLDGPNETTRLSH